MARSDCSPLDEFEQNELIRSADQFAKNGQFGLAQDCYLNAIQIQPSLSVQNHYALFLRNYGFTVDAVSLFKRLHQETLWNQDRTNHVKICQNLCSCYLDLGQDQKAEVFHHQAMIWSEIPSVSLLTRSIDFELKAKNWSSSEELLSEAFTLCQSNREEADLLGYSGAIQVAQGYLYASIPYFFKAYRLHLAEGAFEEAGIDQMNLSEISKSLGRTRSEIRFLKKALALLNQAGVYSKDQEIDQRIRVLNMMIQLDQQIPEWN